MINVDVTHTYHEININHTAVSTQHNDIFVEQRSNEDGIYNLTSMDVNVASNFLSVEISRNNIIITSDICT